MVTLLGQFLSESRDLLEQASRDFLILEKVPDDAAVLGNLFRSVHTMKGASGLFDIAPFTSVVHAAEDLLDVVRDGRETITPEMIDLFLECLDQIAQWLDCLEAAGALGDDAPEIGRAMSQRLRDCIGEGAATAPAVDADGPEASAAALPWLSDLPASVRSALRETAGGGPCLAVEYVPDQNAFFGGDDPLLTMTRLPGALWLAVEPIAPWPPLASLDPFHCNLRFRAILDAELSAVRHALRYVEDQSTITPLTPGDVAAEAPAAAVAALEPALRVAAVGVLASQRAMLETPADQAVWEGRIGSVVSVLTRIAARLDDAGARRDFDARIAAAHTQSRAVHAADPVIDVIASLTEALDVADDPVAEIARAIPTSVDVPRRRWDDPPPTGEGREARKTTSIKVDQAHIDALMNLAGELIVAKNSLPFLAERAEKVYGARKMSREIKAQYEIINRIADDLQHAVMQVRMVPVAIVFQRFTRMVRDLARRLDKAIRLEVSGDETEADKTIVEELADPLVHLLRNAIDHGLETRGERRAAGKPEEGVLRLSAMQQDDRVVIEVADDGRGIDVAKVKGKAVERGLIDAAQAAALDDTEALRLIMQPGLSTVAEVSDLSGRGVGMDVVRNMVEQVGGTIAIRSELGRGTTVTISLPLSMSVHRVMMVDVAREVFGVPIDSIVESVRVPVAAIHRQKRHESIVLRDRLIPLCRLRHLLDLADGHAARAEESVLVVNVDGDEVGLVVDNFRAGIDTIIKPLEGILAGVRHYSGAALLGDGSVLLVLNLRELVRCQWN